MFVMLLPKVKQAIGLANLPGSKHNKRLSLF